MNTKTVKTEELVGAELDFVIMHMLSENSRALLAELLVNMARTIVAHELGDIVEIPEELVQ